jgi:hypothetical protein
MPRPDPPERLPPAVEALIDEALASTGGDARAAIDLTRRKVNEDDAFAEVRGAWMRWFHRDGGIRRPRRWRPRAPKGGGSPGADA